MTTTISDDLDPKAVHAGLAAIYNAAVEDQLTLDLFKEVAPSLVAFAEHNQNYSSALFTTLKALPGEDGLAAADYAAHFATEGSRLHAQLKAFKPAKPVEPETPIPPQGSMTPGSFGVAMTKLELARR